jgi:hypothetical protein
MDDDVYTAKIADLGYAALSWVNKPLQLAVAKPWTDPKYGGESISLSTAKELDSFSFGQVCVWLFDQIALRGDQESARSNNASISLMERIQQGGAYEEIPKLLERVLELDLQQRLNLKELLCSSLETEREQRGCDFDRIVNLLGGKRYPKYRRNFFIGFAYTKQKHGALIRHQRPRPYNTSYGLPGNYLLELVSPEHC